MFYGVLFVVLWLGGFVGFSCGYGVDCWLVRLAIAC